MMYSDEISRTDRLFVCEHCRCGIESHEGYQPSVAVMVDPEDETESKCDWCEETGFDTLYALL